jgi:hypothetical protein
MALSRTRLRRKRKGSVVDEEMQMARRHMEVTNDKEAHRMLMARRVAEESR